MLLFVDNFGFDGFGGLIVHDAARHINEGEDDKHDTKDLENKVWNDDFTEDAKCTAGNADNREDEGVLVVWIPCFCFKSILEAEDAFDKEENANNNGDNFFNETVLNNKEGTGNTEGDSGDKFWDFLHVAIFDAKIGDEIVGSEDNKSCADNDGDEARDFVGPNKERDTKREQNNVHIDRHREFAHLLGGFDLDFANCFIGHVVSL